MAYRPDDWSRFNHQTAKVNSAEALNSLQITTASGYTDTITLLGIQAADTAQPWLKDHVIGQKVTLLLEAPQTRDRSGHLRAFAFLDNENLSVALVKAGLAYVDRREKTEMDGLLDPAESESRKKKRGLWATVTFDQMPAWRQAWLKSLPKWDGK